MTAAGRIAIPLAVLALAASGCGGGNDSADRSGSVVAPQREMPTAIAAKANATCRYLLREIRQIGKGALANFDPAEGLKLTTVRLVKPSIPLLERVARRQQALKPAAHNSQFDLYADLYDPIVAIAHERVHAGLAEDFSKSRDLEDLLTNLGLEQMEAARAAGLGDCDADFQHVLLKSLSE